MVDKLGYEPTGTTHGKSSRNGRKIFEYSIFYTGTLTKSWGPKKHVYHFQFFFVKCVASLQTTTLLRV